jgi:G:T-mismatch repair DNA endonuclease (very short patch repair protein)
VRPPRRPAVLHGCVFRSRDVLADGVLTPAALRSSAWRRLYRGVYADASLPDGVGIRIRGASLLAPPAAVFTGRSAAFLHGATELADPRRPVEVTVPEGTSFGPVTGLRIRHASLDPADVTVVAGRRCSTEMATALAIAADEQPVTSVPALDILLRRGLVNQRELRAAAGRLTGRGARRAQRAVGLADLRAESQPESTLRVLLALGGITTVPQFVVRDRDGGFVGRVDLAVPDLRIAIEYDGAWHGAAPQLSRDRRRMNALTAAGWRVLFVTAADMRDPAALVARIRALLAAATSGKSSS